MYSHLIRLYPAVVRDAYGEEFASDFAAHLLARRGRPIRLAAFVCRAYALLVCDIAAERIGSLYSHRSFHGRRAPDLGVVRPPNMSKSEWFGTSGRC